MSQTLITHAELSNILATMPFDQLKKLLEELVTENYTALSKGTPPRVVLVRIPQELKNV